MAILDVAQFQIISDALGAADADFLSTTDLLTTTTGAYKTRLARQTIYAQASETDFDDAKKWIDALRTIETGLDAKQEALLVQAAKDAEIYVKAQTGQKTRDYFRTGITWANSFRDLWRRAVKEEIIVRLFHLTKSAGSWPGSPTSDKTIELDSTLELRTGTGGAIGAAAITVSLVLEKADGSTELASINIPAATPANTAFAINATKTYVTVQTMTASGGTNGDVLEIWVK